MSLGGEKIRAMEEKRGVKKRSPMKGAKGSPLKSAKMKKKRRNLKGS